MPAIGGETVRRTITLNHWRYLIKFQHQSLRTTFNLTMRHIFGENERFWFLAMRISAGAILILKAG
jgi:hypothetical protein